MNEDNREARKTLIEIHKKILRLKENHFEPQHILLDYNTYLLLKFSIETFRYPSVNSEMYVPKKTDEPIQIFEREISYNANDFRKTDKIFEVDVIVLRSADRLVEVSI